MGIKLEMYRLVKSALENIQVDNENVFQFVGHYNGQEADAENNFAYSTPAAFIGFTNINWVHTKFDTPEKNINREQDGLIEFAVHYFFYDLQTDTDSFEDHLNWINLAYRNLIGLRSTELINGKVSTLRRIREIDQPTNNNLRHWISFYATRLQETGDDNILTDAQPIEFVIQANPLETQVEIVAIDDNTVLGYDNLNNKISINV